MKKNRRGIALLVAVLVGAAGGWNLSEFKYRRMGKVLQAAEVLQNGCIFAAEDGQTEERMLTGMMEALGDRYSYYMNREESSAFYGKYREGETGFGFGFEVVPTRGGLRVGEVEACSPAMTAGLLRGDIIQAINGEPAHSAEEIARAATGEIAGITVSRGRKRLTLYIRAARLAPPKEYVLRELGDGIWYLRIRSFMEQGMEDEVIARLWEEREGIKGLLMDLRANPGGRLNAAATIASAFLDYGSEIVTCEEKGKNRETLRSGWETPLDMPLVVLQDEESASAAEVLAGALKVNRRGVIVGQTSVGKGTMQRVHRFPDGSSIRYTCGRYYLPDGSSLDGAGLLPDVAVPRNEAAPGWALREEEDTQLAAALTVLKDRHRQGRD